MADLALFVCVTYLGLRILVQVARQRRSVRMLPYPGPELVLPACDREFGALAGIAVGDALGAPRESLPPALCALRYGSKPTLSRGVIRFMRRRGMVTDDTQLTWLVAKATTTRGFDAAAFREALLEWYGWRIGPGRGTERAIRAMRRGNPVSDASEGNGAAMRVAPLVLRHCDDVAAMLHAVERSAEVTHPCAAAIRGSQIVALVTRACLLDEPLPTADPSERWAAILADPQLTRTSGWVFDTVECALALYQRHSSDWRAGLTELYALGGDTDTIGAIFCSFVGARYGASCFGLELLREIQGVGALAAEAERITSSRTRACT